MSEQLLSCNCRVCGSPFNETETANGDLCDACKAHQPQSSLPGTIAPPQQDRRESESAFIISAPEGASGVATALDQLRPDPDNPRWSALAGIATWMFSVAAIIVVPFLAIAAWYFIERSRGARVPVTAEELQAWISTPSAILVQVVSLMLAHLITLAFCWVIVTRFGSRPFLASLGEHWGGLSVPYRFLLVFGVVFAMFFITGAISQFLPDSKNTPFEMMLKSSKAVRIVVAFLAVFTAPFVEEAVYRGVLYSSLKRQIGISASILAVTFLFALVHVPQYWGAWASVVGLTILSFSLTVVRAMTGSILPCIAIHTLFNSIGAAQILRHS